MSEQDFEEAVVEEFTAIEYGPDKKVMFYNVKFEGKDRSDIVHANWVKKNGSLQKGDRVRLYYRDTDNEDLRIAFLERAERT